MGNGGRAEWGSRSIAGCRGHPKVTLAGGLGAGTAASNDNSEPAASPSFIIIQMRTRRGISFDW